MSAESILLNDLRSHAAEAKQLLQRVQDHLNTEGGYASSTETDSYRWLAIGRTHLQQGYMAVKRAVEQPSSF